MPRLPSDPSLEHLKKQAKTVLQRFRAGDAEALAAYLRSLGGEVETGARVERLVRAQRRELRNPGVAGLEDVRHRLADERGQELLVRRAPGHLLDLDAQAGVPSLELDDQRTAIVLYLPSLALATVTQFDIVTCIILMGLISILMTFLGGVEAVVWTDVAQTIIFLAGICVTFLFINTEVWQVTSAMKGGVIWGAVLFFGLAGLALHLEHEWITLANLLGAPHLVSRLAEQQRALEGIITSQFPIAPASP